MAEPVELKGSAGLEARAPEMGAEAWIARVLKGGAATSGGLFLASLALEALPPGEASSVSVDVLRRAAAALLLVTPVARLVLAGASLGVRGEWRYVLYAAGVLGLLALAVGAGAAV